VGDPRRPLGQLGEGQALLRAVLLDDPQRREVVVPGDRVEPDQGPVELRQSWPPERLTGGGVVLSVCQQEIARRAEDLRALVSHACDPLTATHLSPPPKRGTAEGMHGCATLALSR